MSARTRLTAAAVAVLGVAALVAATQMVPPRRDAVRSVEVATPRRAEPRTRSAVAAVSRIAGYHQAVIGDAVARRACLATVKRGQGPLLAVLGASFTAGVGPQDPPKAWSVDLARTLGWRTVVAGVPGIGYVHRGQHGVGPLSRLAALLHLARLHPALVVVQAGHDDWTTPPAVERARVKAFYALLHRRLPNSRLATMTVFTSGHRHWRQLVRTNHAIIAGARAGDPGVIVMNPILQDWDFRRAARGQLHPSAQGDRQIAAFAMAALGAHGVRALPDPRSTAPICDLLPIWPFPGLHQWHRLQAEASHSGT